MIINFNENINKIIIINNKKKVESNTKQHIPEKINLTLYNKKFANTLEKLKIRKETPK